MRRNTMTDTTQQAASSTDAFSHLAVERITPQYWRVAFDHGPINTLTAEMVAELSTLVDAIERDGRDRALSVRG